MSEEDDDFSLSSVSDEEDELKDVELMKDILQSIENLRKLPHPSDASPSGCFTEDANQAPVNLDSLTLIELNVILDQVTQAVECNSGLQSDLLMKEVKLLSVKRQIQAFKSANPGSKYGKDEEAKGDIGKYIVKFKSPYFKDHRNFAGYTIVPEKDMPFSAAKYEKASPWTKPELEELESSVKKFLYQRTFQNMMKKKPNTLAEKEKILNRYAHLRKASLSTLVPDDFDEIIDWCHIASRMKKNHSPFECQKAWDIFLKPSINKKRWSKAESEKLKKCALERNFEDWDAIAEDLGTNRSAYQCFHEYVDVIMKLQEGEWSKAEEEFLIKLVKDCTYGDKVLWHKVSYYFESRSLAQLYRKWNLTCVGKNNKVGSFDEEEDQIIIDALIINSGDTNRVARRLNRLPSQIRYRHAQLKSSLKHRYGEWSLEEDEQLLALVEKYGRKKWAQIAEHLPSRGRVQIRHRYKHLRNQIDKNPGKKLEELFRPKRPSHKIRKQSNIKYVLGKKVKPNPNEKSTKVDTVRDDTGDSDGDALGLDTSFGPLVLRKGDVDGVVLKKTQKGTARERRKQVLNPKVVHEVILNDESVEVINFESLGKPCPSSNEDSREHHVIASSSSTDNVKQSKIPSKKQEELKSKKSKSKTKEVALLKRPPGLSSTILSYYSSMSEYIGDPVKPSDICHSELETEITNALLKFKPYKYFDKENADWWYAADRSDPYYQEVFSHVERKDRDEYEIKEGANWLLPPCVTSFEGFHNLLVDIGYKPEDFDIPQDKLDEELKELYCAMDEETIAAVARWKERLKTVFLWPAALSEIDLDKHDEESADENQGCSQILNESEIIQLAEELNQIEDDDLRAVMVRQLGLVDGSNQNKDNTDRLSMLVLQDDSSIQVKPRIQENPGTHADDANIGHCTEDMEITDCLKSEPDDSAEEKDVELISASLINSL